MIYDITREARYEQILIVAGQFGRCMGQVYGSVALPFVRLPYLSTLILRVFTQLPN